ncbi:hypothetical protein KPL70_001147 [Citrus sinensis]|nr:hypothetical protein KPL70_001147 [Citrus sinensis]
MNRQLSFKALTQRSFPMNIPFSSAYQIQDFTTKFLYRYFFNVHSKTPDRFPTLCMENLFLTGLTLSHLSISEDELWYMWCLTTLYATKLVFPVKPVLRHITTPEFSSDLLWTLLECLQAQRANFSFMASTSSSTPVTLSSTLSLPRSCTSHTTNKIENLVEYSYIPESAQIKLLSNSKREGYTHLHLGGIRLILTLHGRKGLPVTARLAMLDTRFKQYQDAVIGTVLTTLHAGSVLLTFYPNFNLSLQDPNLPTTLKVQVQIQEHHSDTLMVLVESDQIPTIIQIPRKIPRHELIKLMPLDWISNYEQFHNNTAPIQTSEIMFERRQDGIVRMTFKPPPSAPQEPPQLSFTYSSMITTVQTAQEDLPITGFNSEGYLVYPAKQNGHFLWDAPGSGMCDPNCPCWDDWEEDDDYSTTRKKKPKKKKSPVSCHHCDPKPPQDPPPPPAPLPFYKKELY